MDEETKIALKGVVKEVLKENNAETVKTIKTLTDKSDAVAKELEIMKLASEIADKSGVSVNTKIALGNTWKSLFGAKVEKDAVLLTKAGVAGTISGDDEDYGKALMGIEVQNGIVRISNEFGLITKFADIRKTSQRTYKLRFDADELDEGGYDDELSTKGNEKIKFTPQEITVKKWRRFIGSSQEAIEDADAVELGAYILTVLAESLALHTDKEGFNALFTNPLAPTQLVNAGGITWDDLIDIQGIVSRNVLSKSIYVFNRKTYNTIKKMKDTTGRPLIDTADKNVLANLNKTGGVGLVAVGFIDIFPVYIADDRVIAKSMGTAVKGDKVGFFGDLFRAGTLVIKKGFEITKDTDFRTEEVSFKGSMRKKFEVKISEAYGVFEIL